jgi:hypothetical protein
MDRLSFLRGSYSISSIFFFVGLDRRYILAPHGIENVHSCMIVASWTTSYSYGTRVRLASFSRCIVYRALLCDLLSFLFLLECCACFFPKPAQTLALPCPLGGLFISPFSSPPSVLGELAVNVAVCLIVPASIYFSTNSFLWAGV